MQDNYKLNTDDKISLKEIFCALWSYKFFVILVCTIAIYLGGNYALTTDKIYTSTASFKLSNPQNNGPSLNRELGALANLAGIRSNNASNELPYNEVMGREFIKIIDNILNLKDDNFFYSTNGKVPVWKSTIKKYLGLHDKPQNNDEIMWQIISKNYKKNISFRLSQDKNAIVVSVRHKIPQRAAEIANTIMQTIIANTKNRTLDHQSQRLDYLSETLADALGDLEDTQNKLKKFTVENTSQPLERFISETLVLDTLRANLSRTTEIHNALFKLSSLLKSGSTSRSDYILLSETFPIVDQVEFRRVLGQNEIISSWTWPNKLIVAKVYDTLTDRKKRLELDVAAAQISATKAINYLEEHTQLSREAKISEATYTVLIEQIKAHSMMAGFQPDTSKVYEYAAPALGPISPKVTIVLAISIIFGLFTACSLALIIAFYHGAYYSYETLINAVRPHFSGKARPLLKTRNIPLNKLSNQLSEKTRTILRNLAIDVYRNKNSLVLFTSLNSKLKSKDLARALASYMNTDDLNIAIINFTFNTKNISHKDRPKLFKTFTTIENSHGLTVLQPDNQFKSIEFIARNDFQEQLVSLQSEFDIVFLSADNSDALSLANALNGQQLPHFSIARVKRTRSNSLTKLGALLPIQGLIYE